MDRYTLMNHWYANIYDQFETHDHDINSILSMAGTVPKNILEVACGTGRISIPLAKAGHNVTGFDMDEFMLERIPAKAEGLSNFTWRQANALTDEWGGGFDVVVLSGNILVNIVTDGDYSEAQELFIQKAAKSLVPGGHLYLDFDCVNWPDMTTTESQKRVVFEGTDDWGTYGRYLGGGGGSYDSKTRIDISGRDYEITPQNGDPFTVTKTWLKHFPTHGEVAGWLEKHGFTIEWENPVREETYHAIIWARKIK